jgi:hypothetical protein
MNMAITVTKFLIDFYNVVILKRRLPLRLRKLIDNLLYRSKFEEALITFSNGKLLDNSNFDIELHIVTSANDALMAVCAAKSLLLTGINAEVVIHSDGTLNDEHKRLFRSNFAYCRILSPEDKQELPSEIKRLRDELPNLFLEHQQAIGKVASIGSRNAWSMKVFDFHLHSLTKKFLILDSDTLFMNEPEMLKEWIMNGEACMYAQPHFPNLRIRKNTLISKLNVPNVIESFNGGLLAIDKKLVSLNQITDLVSTLLSDKEINVYGDECIWRILLSKTNSIPFPIEDYPLVASRNKYLEIKKSNRDYAYIHFLLKYRYGIYTNHLRKLNAKKL